MAPAFSRQEEVFSWAAGDTDWLKAHHVAKAATGRVFERDCPCFVPQQLLNVFPIVKFVVEAVRDSYCPICSPVPVHKGISADCRKSFEALLGKVLVGSEDHQSHQSHV